jgi:hypothetical protein
MHTLQQPGAGNQLRPAMREDDLGLADRDRRLASHIESDDNALILLLYRDISPDFCHLLDQKEG